MLKMDEMVKRFQRYLDLEGKSPLTIREYVCDLRIFSTYVRKDPDQVTTDDVRSFLTYLKTEREYKPLTLIRKIATLRAFFTFLVSEYVVKADDNPLVRITVPKKPERIPVYLTREEVKKIHDRLLEDHSEKGLRNLLIFELYYFTGMRLSELTNLTFERVVDESGQLSLRILGKGDSERAIALNPVVADRLRTYTTYLQKRGITTGYLFINPGTRKRLSNRTIQYLIPKLAQEAGITKRITPHKLRHTFATRLLEMGRSLVEIQQLLGHKQLSTTGIYTHVAPARLAEAVGKMSIE